MSDTDAIASDIAETIATDLRARITDRKFQPRVWVGRDHARIYTGSRDEHLRVYRTGRVERSQSRMSWGGQIDDVLAADPTDAIAHLDATIRRA